jgi:hypothetical protein
VRSFSLIGGIAIAAVVIYGRTTTFGFFSDDFAWLLEAQRFEVGRTLAFTERTHFYRPIFEAYFPTALSICGRSAACYHWLSTALHVVISLLTALLATSVSKSSTTGLLAGLLFVVQPAPVEAVIWVSAVSELLATLFFVTTVWLVWRGLQTARTSFWVLSYCSFIASLLSHESAITLFPMLFLLAWCLYPHAFTQHRLFLGRATPFVFLSVMYGLVAYVVNSRNYVVTGGSYGLGWHVLANTFGGPVTLAVAHRDVVTLVISTVIAAGAAILAPARIRFYTLWILITLLPFAGFQDGLNSRYLYLPAVGFACLVAELLYSLKHALARWGRPGLAIWSLITIALTVRFALFAVRNTGVWAREGQAYREYIELVRDEYPTPLPGARLTVPRPPDAIPLQYVPFLVKWELGDPTLEVLVRD